MLMMARKIHLPLAKVLLKSEEMKLVELVNIQLKTALEIIMSLNLKPFMKRNVKELLRSSSMARPSQIEGH